MKILVTGGSGFIGRNLVSQYKVKHQVFAPPRSELNLLDAKAVRDYLEVHTFDAVIHAAGTPSNRGLAIDPELLNHNCHMFFNLARNSSAFGRMLLLSSGAVYDRAHWRPRMSEDYFDAHVPSHPYGFSKYICAKAIAGMERVHELRLFGVFGPHEDWRVRFLSNACCRAVWDLPVLIRQNVVFDYLDVEDLGRILECFCARNLAHRHYNVCTGRGVDLKTLAERVVAVSRKPLAIDIRDHGLGCEYTGDNARMISEIPEFHFSPLGDSIIRLYRWYEQRKSTIDPALLRFDE